MATEGLACLKFVKNTDNGQQQSQSMSSAVEAVERVGQSVQWVEAEVMDTNTIKEHIYVLDTFDHPLYKTLKGKTRIIGPMVVIAHLECNMPLPASRQPVFTMAMQGVTACCTQIGVREKRVKLMELVKLMGGRVSGNFTRHVTHLVAGQVGSTKYKVARSLKTPVLRPSWIEHCWNESHVKLIKATSEDILSCHGCPPLSGCVVSSTGFSLEGRARLKQLSEENGAEYSSNLVRDTCTHLIVGDIKSRKYQYAHEWKIFCINEEWLYNSIKTGYCMEEHDYPVQKHGNEDSGDSTVNRSSKQQDDVKTTSAISEEASIVSRKRASDDSDGTNTVRKKRPKAAVIEIQDDDDDDDDDLLSQYQNAEMPTNYDDNNSSIFAGKRLSLCHSISERARETITNETQSRGAIIVPVSDTCDYHITPLSIHCITLPSTALYTVTMIWLEHSLSTNTLVDPSSHFLFKPLPIALPCPILNGCVIAISQFEGLERKNLSGFCEQLGAYVQDSFVRYPTNGLLATTHLVLKEPHGDKYQSSLLWGVSAVSDRWLFACATAQAIVSVDEYLIRTNLSLEDDVNVDISHDDNPSHDNVLPPNDVPAKESSFHPVYDLNDISLNLTHSEGPNTQLANIFQSNINKALETVTSHEDKQQDKAGILKGVVINVHKKLSSLKGECHRLVTSMGGGWRHTLDDSCTHFIYQGKMSDASRDKQFQLAKSNGCRFVSSHWLTMCSQSGHRESEESYPCNYDPNRSLAILSQKVKLPSTVEQEDNDESIDQPNVTSPVVPPPQPPLLDDSTDVLTKECDEILQMIERNKRLPSKRPAQSRSGKSRSPDIKRRAPARFNRHGGCSPPDDSHVTDSQLVTVTYEDPNNLKQQEKLLEILRNQQYNKGGSISSIPPVTALSTPSNRTSIPDPVSTSVTMSTNVRLTRSMSRAESSSISCTPKPPPTHLPIVTKNIVQSPKEESLYIEEDLHADQVKDFKPVIILSSLNMQEKADYGSLIQDLGGEYCESDHFLSSCTHLIIGKASRTEKYLAACASGKWILNRTYLEACRAESRFVEETQYEWGLHLATSTKSTHLDEAPKKWRLKIKDSGKKAFEGWRVLLCVEPNKQNGLKRLLEAGDAVVVPSSKIRAEFNAKRITHAFLNPSSRDPQISIKSLVMGGVHCMRPDYIAEYLQRETTPTTEQFILPEALKILNS